MPKYLTNEGLVNLAGTSQLKDDALVMVSAIATELSKRLESVLYFTDIIENQNLIFNEARMEAITYMESQASNVVLAEALKAFFITTEYNYPLYIEHFTNAFRVKQDQIVTFTPESENYTKVQVDFSPLGEILEWENAVIFARAELKVGGGEEPDMEEASFYWYAMVYGPGREGLPVFTYSKKGGAKDVTEYYSGKYEKTISTRLKFLDTESAPFWYLIENGNAPGTMQDRGGMPYPQIAPTHFISKAEIAVAKIFELVLYRFINKVLNDYAYALLKAFDSKASIGFTITDINEVFDTIHKLTIDMMTRGEPIDPIDTSRVREIVSKKVLAVSEFTRKGHREKALRGAGGRFVPSPVPKRNLKRSK